MVENENVDEEISLIDLFAVLVRYRKLIVIGTLLISVLAGCFLFVLPKFVKSLDNKKIEITYSIKTADVPKNLRESLFIGMSNSNSNSNITSIFEANIKALPFFVSQYKKYPFYSENGVLSEKESGMLLNLFVKDLLDKKKIEIQKSLFSTAEEIKATIPESNKEILDNFINDTIATINDNMKEKMLFNLKTMEEDTKESLSNMPSLENISDISSYQNLTDKLQEINKFKNDFTQAVYIEDEPFIIPVAQGRAKMFIIIVFAAAFMLVFLAFLLNAIENIKKDKDSTALLKKAWEEGK